MKYPQLVSPRAVNAISDWLVSRLEQLGVESPQIYTRLLLSLLQSSVQVNDPIEFSNLEAFFANRKGGHKRFHLPSDTETLKKLNAVQCLREIVSNEQETATIEQLVDELCEKLKDIEKQTQNLNNEERFLIETYLNNDSLLQSNSNTQQLQHHSNSSSSSSYQLHSRQHHQQQQQQIQQISNNCQNTTATFNSDSTDGVNDIDNDPKKRYFRAFPALSKEMEDSFRIWRRNAKSLTWPIVGRSIVVDNCNNNINNNNNNINNSSSISSSSASSIISSSNFGNCVSTDKIVEKKLKALSVGHHQLEDKVSATAINISDSGNIGSDAQQQGAVSVAAASVKKKSKRRRNQALCKGKTIQNIRKISVATTSNSVGGNNKYHHYTHHRNSSPPAWDTDFKGCWEMGPDLIKEFLARQNGSKRNHSNSESMEDHEEHHECKLLNEMPVEENNDNDVNRPIMKRYIDLSFCCDDDYDDNDAQHHYTAETGVDYVDEDYDDNTLASVSELAMDSRNPKRLYQREGYLQKSVTCNVLFGNVDADSTMDQPSDFVDPLDFQKLKAKFNSSVEALWKNVEPTPIVSVQQSMTTQADGKDNPLSGVSSAFYATTSLNALAPFKKDLWNFWSNYNQQHYDHQLTNKLSNMMSTSSMITTRLDGSSTSSGAGADIANSSDYFSMPSNLDDFDKSVGSVRRTNEAGASLGAHTPAINVFLQNSIWSTSGDCVDTVGTSTAVDTDESFLFKVWHSNKKLSQLDVGNDGVNGEKMPTLMTDIDGGDGDGDGVGDFIKSKGPSVVTNPNLGANLQFPSYQNLKWSEGINAGPPYSSLRTHTNAPINEIESLNSTSSLRGDINFSNFNSAVNISGATWEAPTYGLNAQPDLKSWCASNPMSLTEMYGNDVCDSIVNQSPAQELDQNQSTDMAAVGPAVTLSNHCANTSSFVAYSRIKQCGIIQPQTKPLQNSNASRLPKVFFRNTEEENLLTSERTHFHPIEQFVDGHTFHISDALDTIEFERTSSGLMRYDSEEYLNYTRNDAYYSTDEEGSTISANSSKFGSALEEEEEDEDEVFVIKFRFRRSGEIACQTEENDFQLAAAKLAEIPTTSAASGGAAYSPSMEVTNMFHNTFSLSRQANNEAIMAAVTKAVAAAAKAAAENHLNAGHFSWLPPANSHTARTSTTADSSNPLWLSEDAASICDEVDFCKINTFNPHNISISSTGGVRGQQQLAENWSMQEVEKQCHQRRCLPKHEIKRKFPSSVDIERSEENSLDNTSLHTLWGMCAVCNSCEYGKSMPANRLLRDELQLEADEIMSDLRYMQDLYIGESDILTETNETTVNTDTDTELQTANKMNCNVSKEIEHPWNMIKKEGVVAEVEEEEGQHDHQVQVAMLQKVNQLIEDLLKTENSGKALSETTLEHDEVLKSTRLGNVLNLQDDDEVRPTNLWQFNDDPDNNVWQHKPLLENLEGKTEIEAVGETFIKPMKLLKQVGGSFSEDSQYIETLNWEHDNLAKIWQHATTQNEETFLQHNPKEIANNNIVKEKFQKEQEEEEEEEPLEGDECSQKLVEEMNLKNLHNPITFTPPPPPPSTAACNTYKRVQQFLNSSAAKLKLAANRKRRHSASQNFYQQQHLQYNNKNSSSNNNNNNDNITDLNAYKQKLNDSIKAAKEQQQQLQLQQQQIATYNDAATTLEERPTKQTIITCKYWTTATNGTQSSLDSAAAAMMLLAAATTTTNANQANATDDMLTTAADNYEDVMIEENMFGNTFSCLIDKNASILKHVTMMTRPLTR